MNDPKPLTLGEFARLCGGTLIDANADELIRSFATDNREVTPGALFLAIKGSRVDGHDFVSDAAKRGAIAAIVERPVEGPHILVPCLMDALAKFAKSKRAEYKGPVIGITGSNGKTSCKEFLSAALKPLGSVVKNPGNKNSELTSPLIWAEVGSDTRSVVVEMAMRGFGQIDHLAAMHKPTHGIITMIGTAHAEMVGGREGIAKAKAEMLAHVDPAGCVALWAEDDYIDLLKSECRSTVKTFGLTPGADCQIIGYRPIDWTRSEIRGSIIGDIWHTEIQTIGKHQALNVAAAMTIANELGVPLDQAADAVRHAELPPMRMQITEWHGVNIVLDNYNASPDSTVAALKTLAEVDPDRPKYAIIGEMKELGNSSEVGHRLVGRALAQIAPDRVLLFGDETSYIMDEAVELGLPGSRVTQVASLADITEFVKSLHPGDTVLIKGSRALGLENALEGLGA